MAIRTKLYQLTQEELRIQIINECRSAKIPVKSDKYGNIWSITHEGAPTFVAHLDTVLHDDKLYKVKVAITGNKLFRPGNILGADDRAGVNLILNHKSHINFLFTLDEEIGGKGAKAVSDEQEFIEDAKKSTFFIELDRRGSGDIIGSKHGYCDDGLATLIQGTLDGYKESYGVYTDIDELREIMQGVNLSVGYEKAHSVNEYLDIAAFEYINSKIIDLSKLVYERKTIPRKSHKYSDRYYGFDYTKYNSYTGYDDDRDIDIRWNKYTKINRKCDWCDANVKSNNKIVIDGIKCNVCDECFDELSVVDIDLKCSSCDEIIDKNEDYVYVELLDLVLCMHCIELKKG